MQISKLLIKLTLVCVFLTSACATRTQTGGLFGTVVGVGAGALVGTLLSRGDVAASALLGGAVGLPVGLLIGYYAQKEADEKSENKKVDRYMNNQRGIVEREREIDSIRDEVLRDSPTGEPDDAGTARIYKGRVLGNPNR